MANEDLDFDFAPVGPCCFCGEPIALEGADPITVSLEARNDNYDVFYAHLACVEKCVKQGNGIELSLR
ncbi:MAG TPA: hypothetical protein VG713_21220 [Pirellulales bacterium]|nr:hypothetical protein [Pirellulales bacterium]